MFSILQVDKFQVDFIEIEIRGKGKDKRKKKRKCFRSRKQDVEYSLNYEW